jgi:hypothetical protein
MVPGVFLQLFLVPELDYASICGEERSGSWEQEVDEGGIPQDVTRPRSDMAVQVQPSLRMVGGAGAPAQEGPFPAGGKP